MRKPLLMDSLTEGEQVALFSLMSHPSYLALEKMLMASCDEVNKALLKLDPGEEGYEKKLVALQSQARERNAFCLSILESINYHAQVHEEREAVKSEKPQQNPITKGINGNESTRNTDARNSN